MAVSHALRWRWGRCSQAGLGHWHPHDLRHSVASLMLAQGVRLEVVSEILGHASITITKDVYGHLVEGDKPRAAASIGEVLLDASSPIAWFEAGNAWAIRASSGCSCPPSRRTGSPSPPGVPA